jgi:hypothetical protein
MNTVYYFLSKLILEPYSMLFFFDIGLTVSHRLLEWCNSGDKLRWTNILGDVVYCYKSAICCSTTSMTLHNPNHALTTHSLSTCNWAPHKFINTYFNMRTRMECSSSCSSRHDVRRWLGLTGKSVWKSPWSVLRAPTTSKNIARSWVHHLHKLSIHEYVHRYLRLRLEAWMKPWILQEASWCFCNG